MIGAEVIAVVPVWDDYVAYAGELVARLREQPDIADVIVVDNASAVPVEIEGARVVRLPRRVSLGAARNAGLEAVTTPFVSFWDADDLPANPAAMRVMVEALRARPGAVAACGRSVDSRTGALRRWPPPYASPLSRHRRVFALANAIRCCFVPVSCVLPADVVRDAGGFADSDVAEDWALSARLAVRGRVVLLDTPVRWYRIHPRSVWSRDLSLRAFHRHRALVRRCLATDQRLPPVLRTAMPLLALLQLVELYGRLLFVERLGRRSERTAARADPPRRA